MHIIEVNDAELLVISVSVSMYSIYHHREMDVVSESPVVDVMLESFRNNINKYLRGDCATLHALIHKIEEVSKYADIPSRDDLHGIS